MICTTVTRTCRRTRLLLALLAAALCCGLVWGLTGALADSGSPSPAAGPTLHLGWTSEPDNLNPFIGYADQTYEIWRLNYSTVWGYSDNNQPGSTWRPRCPRSRTAASRPTARSGRSTSAAASSGQDGQPLTAEDVAFTYNYAIKNDMSNWTNYLAGIERCRGRRPDDGAHRLLGAQGQHGEGQRADPARAHLVARLAVGGQHELRGQVPAGRQRALPDRRRSRRAAMSRWCATPTSTARQPTIDKIYFEMYQDADTMVSDLESDSLDAAWGDPDGAVQAAAFGTRLSRRSPTSSTTGATSSSTATTKRARWAIPCCVTGAFATP